MISPELNPILDPNRLSLHGRFHIPRDVWERMPKSIPTAPADNVPGELSFNEADGVVLKLHGHFSRWGPPSLPGSGKAIPTVFGSDGHTFCALYGSHSILSKGIDPLYSQTHYSPREILVFGPGQDFNWSKDPKCLEDFESLRCSGFVLKSKLHLQHWLGQGGVALDADRTKVSFQRLPSSTAFEDGTRVDLSFGHDTNGVNGRFGFHVEQAAFLRITFDRPRPLHGPLGIHQILRILHGLVAVGTGKSVSVENVTLEFDRSGLTPIRARLYRRWAENLSASSDPISLQPVLPFTSIGGLSGIVKWVNAIERYWLPMLRVINRWMSPSAYLENKFNDVYVALESIARIRAGVTSGKPMKMHLELQRLASTREVATASQVKQHDEAGLGRFRRMIGNARNWSKAMARERSRLVIHPGMDCYSKSGSQELRPLFETGYILAVLCLLREAGIPSAAGREMCKVLSAAGVVEEPLY